MTSLPRFSLSAPPTPEGRIDWMIFDHAEPISIDSLVEEANHLNNRYIDLIHQRLELLEKLNGSLAEIEADLPY